jgi:hypothetical protein
MNIDTASAWGQVMSLVIEIAVIIFGGFRAFEQIKRRLDRLEDQYKPNGGSSMRDAINRIENKLAKLEGKFEQHIEEDR